MFGSRDSVPGGMEIAARHQRAGHLWKLPMSKPASEKWQRRFFVAKDGFLLYYANGRSDQAHFDTKPKGCIPLGGCKVDLVDRGPKGIRFGLRITHPDFFAGRLLILAAENDADQKAWLEALSDCSRVTMHNARVGEAMIEKLRAQGTTAEREKQDALEKMQKQALELIAEQEEKSKLLVEGETLKSAMLEATERAAKKEAEMAVMMADLEVKRKEVEAQAEEIHASIAEKAAALAASDMEYKRLQEALAAGAAAGATGGAAGGATGGEMEDRARALEEEKLRLEREKLALERSVRDLTNNTILLQSNLESAEAAQRRMQMQLAQVQNEEGDLLKERQLRKRVERKLQIAEDSLKRLDHALKRSGVKLDVDVFADVKTLLSFFEERVEENRRDAQRIDIMKKALQAKRRYLVASARADNFDTAAVLGDMEEAADDAWDEDKPATAVAAAATGGAGTAAAAAAAAAATPAPASTAVPVPPARASVPSGGAARPSVTSPTRAVRRSMSMQKGLLGTAGASAGSATSPGGSGAAAGGAAATAGAGTGDDEAWDDDDSVGPEHSDDEAEETPGGGSGAAPGVVKAALVGVVAGMHHDHVGPLPDGWTVQVDEEGDIWYFNEISQATSWYRPNPDGSIPAAAPGSA